MSNIARKMRKKHTRVFFGPVLLGRCMLYVIVNRVMPALLRKYNNACGTHKIINIIAKTKRNLSQLNQWPQIKAYKFFLPLSWQVYSKTRLRAFTAHLALTNPITCQQVVLAATLAIFGTTLCREVAKCLPA